MDLSTVILRGISGSGKSTFAASVDNRIILSADDYFVSPDGEYRFDAGRLAEAHQHCLRHFVDLCRAYDSRTIVIDNTNTRVTELAPYAALSEAYGRELLIVTVACPVDVAAERNRHNTPRAVVEAQAKRLEAEPTPLWWRSTTYDVVAHQGHQWLDSLEGE